MSLMQKNKLLKSGDPDLVKFSKGVVDHILEKAIEHFRCLDGKPYVWKQYNNEKTLFLASYFNDLPGMSKMLFEMQYTNLIVEKVFYTVLVSH